jgi:uncharacterized protein YhaN
MAANFGRLEKSVLELREGLNILKAPNESGKSTWCAFLSAMFYGINSRERDRTDFLSDKNRYAPWNGTAMSGRMDCTALDGLELTLIRETRRPTSPMGQFQARLPGGGAVPDLTESNCGETLLGVPKSVFEQSAFIRQSSLGISSDAELQRRILSLVTTGEEDTSYIETSAALRRQLNRRRHNRTGEIPALEAEYDETLRRIESLRKLQSALRDAALRTQTLESRESELMRDLEQCSRYEAALAQRTLRSAEETLRQAQKRASTLREKLEEDQIPENEAIGRLRGAIVNLGTMRKNTVHAEEIWNSAGSTLLLAEAAVRESPFAGMSAEDARQVALTPPKVSGHSAPALCVLLGGLAAACLILLFLRPTSVWGGTLRYGLTAVLAAGSVLLSSRMRRRALRHARNAALRKRYGTEDSIKIAALADAYGQRIGEYESARDAASAAEAALASLREMLSSSQQAILLEVRRFSPNIPDLAAADQALRECAVRRRDLTLAESDAREALIRYETLSRQTEAAPQISSETAPPPADRATLTRRLEGVRSELAAARSAADRLSGQLTALGDPAELDARAGELRRKLDVLGEEYDALALALEALEDANTTLQNRFSPALSRRAAEIFSELTDGRYTGVTLDRALRPSAQAAGDPIPRSFLFLSAGAVDQLYLAIRLAICELVFPRENAVPIILDDALANFDDARCAAALRWLRREAERRQILLFTCHSREADFFRNDPDVTIRELTDRIKKV